MEINISQRLRDVSDFIPQGSILLDVGSDHAYLPLYLLEQGRISSAIAGEVAQGPYQSALNNAQGSAYADKIDVRLADGLAAFDDSDAVDVIAICGMGGRLIADILAAGREKLDNVKRLVLQPNNCEDDLRYWLSQHSFTIFAEKIMTENHKYYEIIVAGHGRQQLQPQELRFGPCLLQEGAAVFKERWQNELQKLEKALEQIPETNQPDRRDIQQKIEAIKEAISYEGE
ncbi:tRNA (adenine(22)-N(1))-methyltransferase [Streptococcus dentasini]